MTKTYDEVIERAEKMVERCINSYVELRDLDGRKKEIVKDALVKIVLCDEFYYLLRNIEWDILIVLFQYFGFKKILLRKRY